MEWAFLRYLRHHRAIGSTAKTLQYHQDTLKRSRMPFLRGRGHSLRLGDLHLDDVLDWIDDQRSRGLSQKTVQTRVISVKAFTRWLVAEEWLDLDPLAKLKVPKVDDKPKDTLLKACNPKTLTGCRDRAILLLLYSTGLRADEAVRLRVEDIDWAHGLITVRRGKGGKYRVVPLGGKTERALDKYLNHPKRPDHEAVFLTHDGNTLSYQTFRTVFYRLEKRAGIRCNPHKWRHSAAIQYLRQGGRVEHLQKVLGHTTPTMTLHYARLAGVDLTTAHETADPTKA